MRKRRLAVAGVGAVAVAAAAIGGFLRRYEIVENSMYPALRSGDWVVARRRVSTLARGDIVVFDDASGRGTSLVKRVVGLPDELVTAAGGQVHVDGEALAEHWAHGPTYPSGEWNVPEGHVFVLGDNRPASTLDSRTIGPVVISAVEARIMARYWPPSRAGLVPRS